MNSLKLSKDFFYISPDFLAIQSALKEQEIENIHEIAY